MHAKLSSYNYTGGIVRLYCRLLIQDGRRIYFRVLGDNLLKGLELILN